jgi:hypothetical protein
MNREQIAAVAHEINRAYCASLGDTSQAEPKVAWADASAMQKAVYLAAVDQHLDNPELTPEETLTYDADREQTVKAYLLRATVHALKNIPDTAAPAEPVTVTVHADGTVPVTYIGHREQYSDGAYGSRIVWQRGQTIRVPGALAAKLLRHTDVYALGKDEAASSTAAAPAAQKVDEDAIQDLRDQVNAMRSREAVTTYAKTHFNMDLDGSKKLVELRADLIGLIDQYGVQ